ncbi:MAG: TetR/AcrR family transcriptional regulator [Lachnospiraceae bacterium]|nr:TetR/AcrR family transcriptional regulator [Lachnospiraceae bacterium]
MSRKQEIIDVCVEMIDKDGFMNLSIKAIADRLGIKPPSLYKHFQGGLVEIKDAIMVYGWNFIDIKIAKSAVGKSREEGLKAMCYALREFAHEHPGVFEAICWHNSYTSELNHEMTKGVVSSLYSILDPLEFSEVNKMHVLRSLRGFVEGFSMLELHGSFGDKISLDESFEYGVDALISGIMKD